MHYALAVHLIRVLLIIPSSHHNPCLIKYLRIMVPLNKALRNILNLKMWSSAKYFVMGRTWKKFDHT